MYISQDPIRLNGGLNLYSYVGDTNAWVDPKGLIPTSDTGINGQGYDIYAIKDSNGKVIYVGETNDFERRKIEHGDSGRYKPEDGMTIDRIDRADTYGEARGKEQYHIEKNKTLDTKQRGVYDANGKIPTGAEANRTNSYDRTRTDTRAEDFNKAYKAAEKQHGKLCNK